ncbi:MAG: peroxide stress protein YaaA [Pseudomonadales bacterium]|nr:peroxide stress protein YaaA [Pseudomonadales bacterium]
MLIILSPAKTLDFESPFIDIEYSLPEHAESAAELIDGLKKFDRTDVMALMDISEKLADLNLSRFQQWSPKFSSENSRQAILAFKGDVYSGLEAETLSADELEYAQSHLRILSGLYGILRPLDLMQPYRLEMGRNFGNLRGKNLYQFWGDLLTDDINKLLKAEKYLVNLASNEYFKAVKHRKIEGEIITPIFKDFKNGQYKVISFYAKKARGAMARYIIENRIKAPQGLEQFDWQGYRFNEELSAGNELVFTRHP